MSFSYSASDSSSPPLSDFESEADCTVAYVGDTISLVLQKEDLEEEDRRFFLEAEENGEWNDSSYLQERILMRASSLGCIPKLRDPETEGKDFWSVKSEYQRKKHVRLELELRTEVPFGPRTCPCYICGGKCLDRLYGKNPVTRPGDDAKGYLSWEKGHVIPRHCGKNNNFYNLRILCVNCNRQSGSLFPYIYALSSLPIGVETLATNEEITSYLQILKLHFEK